MALEEKSALVARLLEVKKKSGKTFSEIASKAGLTNAYVAQLFHRQASLGAAKAKDLRSAVPDLTDDLIAAMMEPPTRTYDPSLTHDPTIYRLHEATMHYGQSIKAIINEELGDGIMSAVGFYCTVEKVKGKEGEDRVVIIMNGKYLPFTVQVVKSDDIEDLQTVDGNVAKLAPPA